MKWKWPFVRDTAWRTAYPLPRDTADLLMSEPGDCENFGLLLDRYAAYGAQRGRVQLVRELSDRTALVPDFACQREMVEAYAARWRQQVQSMTAVTFTATPEWRVIVGMATNAVLESGINLHPVCGIPIIPGSALKGVSRLYAEAIEEAPQDYVDVQFGWLDEDQSGCGNLVFLDAYPADVPQIERDVVCPIYGEYYRGESPPAGYLSAQPFFFLALGKASRFEFGVAALDGDAQAAEDGANWLRKALQIVGVGAKTAAGYGFWNPAPTDSAGEPAE